MTPSARTQAVLEILSAIDEVARPADALVSAYFRARRYIGSSDRGEISTLTYDALRHQARLGWWVEKLGGESSPRTRLLAYMALVGKKLGKTIAELFTDEKFAPAPLSTEEKALLGRLLKHTLFHPDMPDTVACECPDWAAESLKRRFGRKFTEEMTALLSSAPLDLRINPLKVTREEALAQLKAADVKAKPCRLSPLGLRVKERINLNTLPLLKNGGIEIQDEGSQLVALLVEGKAGERIVDFCAGAGGKTLAISATMENKGKIFACDVLANRLKRSAERFRRAGLHNIETKPLTTENDPWVKRHKESFDRVLVDAPCSGTGTWRRNPDARWKTLGPGLEALLPLQASILASAARLVKKGGRLVYATCSMLREENETQIEAFLAAHPDFALVPVTDCAKRLFGAPYTGDMLSLTPFEHDTDGFFAAVMEKR